MFSLVSGKFLGMRNIVLYSVSTTLHNGMVSFLEKHSCFHAYLCYYLDTYTVKSRAETHVTIQEINFGVTNRDMLVFELLNFKIVSNHEL